MDRRLPAFMYTARSRWGRGAVVAAIIAALMTLILVLDYGLSLSDRPVVSVAYSGVKALLPTQCPADCPLDPFTMPGMLHWSTLKGRDNETRWMPFPAEHRLWEAQSGAWDLPHSDVIPSEAWAYAPDQLTARMEQGEDFAWMRGRTVLFVGSSHDRNNVQQLCEIIKGKYTSWGGHTGGGCYVERLDLLISNWFLFGMVDEDDKWPSKENPPHTFETRFDEVMRPHMESDGWGERKIDLAVMSSLFWDQKFFDDLGREVNKTRGEAHGFLWNEIAWHRGRVRKMVQKLRDMYGRDLPIMYRTRQIRHETRWFHMLKIFQLDQGMRALSNEMGVKLFTWGGKLEGYAVYYDEDQHFAKGPNTYLFGDMAFFYLHRAITKGCWTCRPLDK